MMVRVHSTVWQDGAKGPSSILTQVDHAVQIEQPTLVRRICIDVRIIKRPISNVVPLDQAP